MNFKNTLRWMMGEDLITHLGAEYYLTYRWFTLSGREGRPRRHPTTNKFLHVHCRCADSNLRRSADVPAGIRRPKFSATSNF